MSVQIALRTKETIWQNKKGFGNGIKIKLFDMYIFKLKMDS